MDSQVDLHALVQAAGDAIIVADSEGRIVLWNPAAERLFGFASAEAIGGNVDRIVPPAKRDEARSILARIRAGERVDHLETVRLRRDGTAVAVSLTVSPVLSSDGAIAGASMIARDVTAELEVREQFRLAVEANPSAILVTDAAGTILMVNAQAEETFGYDRAALLGETLETLLPEPLRALHAEHRLEYTRRPAPRAMGAGREIAALRADGVQIPVEVGLSPFTTAQGIRVMATVVDVRERRRAAEEHASYNRRLEKSNADLEQFAYVVSHDLKSPLRGIASVASWLAEDFKDVATPDALENVALMLERTRRLESLIDGILAYSRVGKQSVERTTVDTFALVEDVVAAIDPPPEIQIRIDGALPRVTYDETQLRQVFQNLIQNAVQHLDRPHGTITIECERAADAWCFLVSDDGVGIPPAHREIVFRLFQTLKPRDASRSTGLGLSLARQIVCANGGTIGIETAALGGAAFRFTVPDVPPDAAPESAQEGSHRWTEKPRSSS
jgi:PAS domain S-box-containing protein